MYGGVQMYGGVHMCRAYRHMGDVQGHTDVWGVQMYGGVYRCIEDIDIVEDVWGHTSIQGGIEMYGEHTDVWGMYKCMGVFRCGGHTDTPQTHAQPNIPPHACQLHLGTIFLIKFKVVPYRHILLAHTNLLSNTAIHEASHCSW